MPLPRYSSLAAAVLLGVPCSAASAQVLPGGHHQHNSAAGSYAASIRVKAEYATARWKEAWDAHDAAAIAALCAKSGVLIVGDGPVVRGRAAIRDFLATRLPLTYPITIEPSEFGMSGEVAYTAGLVAYQMRDDAGNSFAHRGPYSLVLRTQDSDVWEIQLLAIPGPAAPPAAPVVRARENAMPVGGSPATGSPAGGPTPCLQAARECPQEGQNRAPDSETTAPQAAQLPAR